MVEVKNKKTSYGRSGLNKNQKQFASEWAQAPLFVVYSAEEAIAVVSGYAERMGPATAPYLMVVQDVESAIAALSSKEIA